MENFFSKTTPIDKNIVQSRIISTCSAHGWQETIAYILKKRVPFHNLKIAEVGCGTGTFSLTLNLLGASTTLIDLDNDALNTAQRVFALYNREANFIKTDVLKPVPKSLEGCFDIVISGGLAEHFLDKERDKCISFHRILLKKYGFAYIGVPNKLSICYQFVRYFRMITGTWKIGVEKPFTFKELKEISKKVGFSKSEVIGNWSLKKDLKDYFYGLVSAILDVLPDQARKLSRKIRLQKEKVGDRLQDNVKLEAKKFIFEKVNSIKKSLNEEKRKKSKDYFSAGIILFGFVGDNQLRKSEK